MTLARHLSSRLDFILVLPFPEPPPDAFVYAAPAFDKRAKLLGVRLTARRKSQCSGPFAPGPGIHHLRIGCTKNNDGKRVSGADCPAAIGGCERVK